MDDVEAIRKATKNIDSTLSSVVYALGFPGSILSIIVWLQPRMRTSNGNYLLALGFVDLLNLVIHVLSEIHRIWDVNVYNYEGVCELFSSVFRVFRYLSQLLVFAFTVDRFIAVCLPTKRHKFCTTFRADLTCFVLLLISAILGSLEAYIHQYNDGRCNVRKSTSKKFIKIWQLVTLPLIFVFISLLIGIFNFIMVISTNRRAAFNVYMLSNPMPSTRSLIVASFYVATVSLLATSLRITLAYADLPETFTWDKRMLMLLILDEIWTTQYVCKFFIFLVADKLFRQEFSRVILRTGQTSSPINRNVSNTEMTDTSLLGNRSRPSGECVYNTEMADTTPLEVRSRPKGGCAHNTEMTDTTPLGSRSRPNFGCVHHNKMTDTTLLESRSRSNGGCVHYTEMTETALLGSISRSNDGSETMAVTEMTADTPLIAVGATDSDDQDETAFQLLFENKRD